MRRSYRRGEQTAPGTASSPVRVVITHPGHPYQGREATVTRVRYGAHVDLVVVLDGGPRINIDSTWTDYWEQRGESPPAATAALGVCQVRELILLLGRLKRRVNE